MISVAELAERSGLPVRTLRFYQTEGLLPAPRRVGREARYDASHLDRLRLIAELRARGFRLSTIREAVKNPDAWFGLGETLAKPWTEDRPALWTQADLDRRLEGRPVRREDLEAAGLLERRTDTLPVTYLVASPGLVDLALELAELGVPADVAKAARETMQRRLGRLADDLVSQMTESVSLDRLRNEGPEAVAALVERLRPLTQRAVGIVFAHEMERALRTVTGDDR